MGDQPPISGASEDNADTSSQAPTAIPPVAKPPVSRPQPPAVETNRSPAPQAPQQHHSPQQNAFQGQYDYLPQRAPMPRQGSFNMTPVAMNLPHPDYRPQHYHPGYPRYDQTGPPMMMHPQSFSGQPPSSMHTSGFYGQMPSYYSPDHMSASGPPHVYPQQGMPYYGQVPPSPQSSSYYGHTPQPRHSNYAQLASTKGNVSQKSGGNQGTRQNASRGQKLSKETRLAIADSTSQQPVIRGPARKPRQSGHAVWIGNLPSQTDIMALVHFVCKETTGLESLFLISKSNCAFANFKDEEACNESQHKLHDAKFQTVRLVCRLRKGSADDSPTQANDPTTVTQVTTEVETRSDEASSAESPAFTEPAPSSDEGRKDRFFILKSLMTEDLDTSMSTGVWATQSHNEELLNAAFKSAENVYLIFSANKSGEYYGYARMTSQINQDPSAAIKFAPQVQPPSEQNRPQAVPTEATDNTPAGRIVDDAARGTIFWETESEESDDELDDEASQRDEDGGKPVPGKPAEAEDDMQTVGKPFNLEWLSNDRLPFLRTRGLRNPWNSNREVKVARDGTELEPSVGKRLISLFHSTQKPTQHRLQPNAPPGLGVGVPQMPPNDR